MNAKVSPEEVAASGESPRGHFPLSQHELKGAIIYRLHERAETQSGRGMILEKYYVAYRGDQFEFGPQVYAEALTRGLHQADLDFS